jgi:hypothetical protein
MLLLCALLRLLMLMQHLPPPIWQGLVFSGRHHPCLSSRELKAGGNASEHDGDNRRVVRDGANGGDKMQALDECGVGDLEQHEPRLDA